jgi:hypothetical protein
VPDSSELRLLTRQLLGARAPASAECKRLLEQLRQRCPDLFPPDPLPAGKVGPEIALRGDEVQRLFVAAAAPPDTESLLWRSGDSELLVLASRISVGGDLGTVVVSVPVRCDQSGDAVVEVPFAVGDDEHPAGMLVATEERPRGPVAVVDVWGEALVAFAWNALLTMTTALAAESGTDEDGAGLIPAAIAASTDGLRVLTMARHPFDRVRR